MSGALEDACLTQNRCSDEEPGESSCPQNVQLKWATEVSSSIYATPVITDLYSDAHKDIVVPGFVSQLEVSYSTLSARPA